MFYDELKVYHFSLNFDKATSKNLNKVVTVLASYYSESEQKIIVVHLSSFVVLRPNADSIFNCIQTTIELHNLPWISLISCLMDSCNVMRCHKSGVEAKLCEMAPHLLDIDWDTFHHTHNVAKTFCAPFENYLENLFIDLFTDVKWSQDIRDDIEPIYFLVGLKYLRPQQYVSTRWLSCFDIAVSTQYTNDAYLLYYYSFLPKQIEYKDVNRKIFTKRIVSMESQNAVRLLQVSAKKGNNTKGAERKQRIVQKLYKNNLQTNLYLHIQIGFANSEKVHLPVSNEEMIDELKSLLLEFLSSCKRLTSLDIKKNLRVLVGVCAHLHVRVCVCVCVYVCVCV